MRRAATGAVLALALVGCTKVGPPPPGFYATLEAIRVELTAAAPASLAFATATSAPLPTPEPTPLPSETPPPLPTRAPAPTVAPAPAQAEVSPTAPAVAASPTPVLYTVQRGDYLSLIAAEHGVTVEALIAANEITNPNVIEVGQVLTIPLPEATPGP